MSDDMTAQPRKPRLLPPFSGFRARTQYSPAFTMIEMLIVVGIIAVLLAVAIPASFRLVASTKSKTTLRTLEVVQSAIERYHNQLRSLPPDYFVWYAPPRLPERWDISMDSNANGECDAGELPAGTDQTNTSDPGYNWCNRTELTKEFSQISDRDGLRRRPTAQPTLPALSWPVSDNTTDPTLVDSRDNQCHRTIESLYLFATRLCPEANTILKQLPENAFGNTDICAGQPCPDAVIFGLKTTGYADDPPPTGRGEVVELKEILDAWGHPLHYGTYSIRATAFDPAKMQMKEMAGDRSGWTLRSDGPDGIPGNGDDITLSGTTK